MTVEYSCRAWAPLAVSASELLDGLRATLARDGRVIAPVVGYDLAHRRIDAIFQVETVDGAGAATTIAVGALDAALAAAGLEQRTRGVSIVAGGPHELP